MGYGFNNDAISFWRLSAIRVKDLHNPRGLIRNPLSWFVLLNGSQRAFNRTETIRQAEESRRCAAVFLLLWSSCGFLPHGDCSLCPVWLLALPFINCDPVGALEGQLCHGSSVLSQYQASLPIVIAHRGHDAAHYLVLTWRERGLTPSSYIITSDLWEFGTDLCNKKLKAKFLI